MRSIVGNSDTMYVPASQAQYDRYMALANKYEQTRPELAKALRNQAQRELEKGAVDINDVRYDDGTPVDPRSPEYAAAKGTAQVYNVPQTTATLTEQVADEPVVANTPVYNPPVYDADAAAAAAAKKAAEEAAAKKAAEEAALAEQERQIANGDYRGAISDSDISGGMSSPEEIASRITAQDEPVAQNPDANLPTNSLPSWLGGNGTDVTPVAPTDNSADIGPIYDPDLFTGGPSDSVYNTPEEIGAKLAADKKKQKQIEELANIAKKANIGPQYWGRNRVY